MITLYQIGFGLHSSSLRGLRSLFFGSYIKQVSVLLYLAGSHEDARTNGRFRINATQLERLKLRRKAVVHFGDTVSSDMMPATY